MKVKVLSFFFCTLFFFAMSQDNNSKLDSLKLVLNSSANSLKKAETLSLIIDHYFEVDKDSAEVYIQKTLKYTNGKNELEQIYCHTLLKYAQLYIVKGDYDTSTKYYNQTWEKLKQKYNYFLYNKYYGDFGVLNFYKGDFKTALQNFDKALQLARKEKNETDQLRFLNNKALAMSYLGEAEASLDVHHEAIKLAEKLNDSTALGKSFNNIGLIYEDMQEYFKALEYYQKSLVIKKRSTSKIDVANSLFNIANMYKEIGKTHNDTLNFAKAERYFKIAIAKSQEIKYGKVLLFSKIGLAELATLRNTPLKAIAIFNEVIKEAETSNDNQTLRVTYLNLGVNYLKINKIREAETYLLKALPLIEAANKPSDMADIYKNLSELYQTKQDFKNAFGYLKKQTLLEKELTKNSLQTKISEFEIKYETEKKEKEILSQRANLAEKELHINQKNTQIIGLGILVVVIGLLGYLVYNQQRLKNNQLQKEAELNKALIKIESQNNLQEQRLRISRDLHDNIGAQLTFIISSIDNLQYGFKITNEKLTNKLSSISEFTRETIYELRDTIWAMNKNEISLEDLRTRISNFIEKGKEASSKISFSFNVEDTISQDFSFSSVVGMNIYRIVQEAMNNAIKYANPSTIRVNFNKFDTGLEISIVDDGNGFDLNTVSFGNGLNNMKKRAQEMGSKLCVESSLKMGTRITINV